MRHKIKKIKRIPRSLRRTIRFIVRSQKNMADSFALPPNKLMCTKEYNESVLFLFFYTLQKGEEQIIGVTFLTKGDKMCIF